jgi:hypothetical protein
MATKTVVCPECESPLAHGRFSCSACGALVASVASATRSFLAPEPLEPAGQQSTVAEPLAEPPAPVQPAAVAHVRTYTLESAETTEAADDGWDDVPDAPIAEEAAVESAAPAATVPGEAPAWPDVPSWPIPTSASPRTSFVRPVLVDAEPHGTAAHGDAESIADGFSTDATAATPHVPAGAYLPPSAVLPPGELLPLPGAAAAGVGAAAIASPRASRRWLPDLGRAVGPLAIPADAGIRTIATGGGVATLGFLLPWADIVIGSRNLGNGFLEQWGLAGPAALLALALVLGLTSLAVMRPSLPAWIGLSTPAIALACLLVGLAWPYLFGSFGTSIGIYVVVVGALILAAGGLLDRVASRHGEPPTAV